MDPATIASTVGAVLACFKSSIARHVMYIIKFKKIVSNFKMQLDELEARKTDIQNMADTSNRNLQEPSHSVTLFLNQYDKFKREYADNIQSLNELDVRMVKLHKRHRISTKSSELVEEIKGLMKLIHFDNPISTISAPGAVIEMPTDYLAGLDSVEEVRLQVMKAIEDANTTMIGLYGMGGVGKTTLMERINNDLRINNSHGFTYIIMVTVSATPNICELQDKIAKRVGYKDIENESYINSRACKLKERLRKEKSILIILDDVWERLDLKKVGIPSGSGENDCCKIVLTTRNADICKQMDVAPIIPMACLEFDESWKLFEEKSGAIESKSIRAIAKDVCKECAGLPLVISIVASTLRHNTEKCYWDLFRSKLMEYNPKGLSIIQDKVYISLKLSYDHLKRDDFVVGEHLQLCFLFCSLFPEDHEIHLHDLMCYGIGEDFIACHEGVSTLRYTLILVSKLKGYGLLLDAGRGEMYVKMHDVVRDAAIFIAMNDEKSGFYTNFKGFTKWPEGDEYETKKRISLMGNSIQHVAHHPKFDGKRMKSLLLNDNRNLETIADNFFEEMEDLLVLDLRGTDIKSLPSSIQNLTKLRVLMVSSMFVGFLPLKANYSVNVQHLFSMVHLSVLILRDSRISELTKEFGDLVLLKVLDFTNTPIDIIWPDVLSKLKKLEELLMFGSFNRWDGCNEDGKSFVSFFELDSLKRLYVLKVEVANDQKILSKRGPDNFLQSFADRGQMQPIFFHINFVFPRNNMYFHGTVKANELSLKGKLQFPNWILRLMKETEILNLKECKSFQQQLMQNSKNSEDYGVFKNLRELKIDSCENLEDAVLLKSDALKFFLNLEDLHFSNCKLKRVIEYYSPNRGEDIAILPKLVSTDLWGLDELEDIFASIVTPTVMPNGSFQRLKTVNIHNCSKLKFIFQWNVAVCLVQLAYLSISCCSQLEVIVGQADIDYDQVVCGLQTQVLFPKLRYMELSGLPNLESLWQQQIKKRMEMEWPSLEEMSLFLCDKLNRLFWGHQSAPRLKCLYLDKYCFEELIWEDDKAATRFNCLVYHPSPSQQRSRVTNQRERVFW